MGSAPPSFSSRSYAIRALVLSLLATFVILTHCCEGSFSVTNPRVRANRLAHVPYNPLMALYSLHLCKASYCVPEVPTTTTGGHPSAERAAASVLSSALRKEEFRGLTFELYNVYVNTSYKTLAYSGVDHVNQRVLVAFRGSANLANWLSDLTFWSSHYPCPSDADSSSSSQASAAQQKAPHQEKDGRDVDEEEEEGGADPIRTDPGECRVHKGFYDAYHSLSENITSDLIRLHLEFPHYSFLITGHSLGGAMAYLCALDMVTRPSFLATATAFAAPFEVYTFGEPRSGNEALNTYAATLLEHHPNGNRKHFRLTHGRDPVPHLPPMSWGYLHQPQELWYYRNGTEDDNPFVFAFCQGNATSEDPMCSNSVWSTTVSDHLWYMGTCTRCLCQAADKDKDKDTAASELRLRPDLEQAIAQDRAQQWRAHGVMTRHR